MNDIRFAIRQLLKNPGFAAVVVLTLAIAIGANSAILSIVKDVIIDPIPHKDSDKLMYLHVHNPARFVTPGVSSQFWEELRNQDQFFEDIVSYQEHFRLDLEGGEFVERLKGSRVMPGFFGMLGVRPQLGRFFSKDAATSGDTLEIILSHGLWQSQYVGDTNIVGQSIVLGQAAYIVAGVMPREFEFPRGGTQFWVPMMDPHLVESSMPQGMGKSVSGNWPVVFRLREGAQVAGVQTMLNTLIQQYVLSDADNEGWIIEVNPLAHRFSDAKLRTAFYGIMGGVLFVLLIGCFNLAGLLLSRFESRRREFAIRQAIGAHRSRLVRQLMAESLLMSLLGGLAGLVVAYWSIELMALLIPAQMPRLKEIHLDLVTVLTITCLCLGVCVLTGLIPALQTTKGNIYEVLKEAASSLSLDFRRKLFRRAQVVLQISLTLVLLAGAGLMIRSMIQLLKVDLGYQPENLVRVELDLPDGLKTSAERSHRNSIFSQIEESYEALPGVKSAAFYTGGYDMDFLPEGADEPANAQPWLCSVEDSGLLSTLGVPLIQGRDLSIDDARGAGGAGGLRSVVVNETMARLFWPDQDPIGKRFGPNFSMPGFTSTAGDDAPQGPFSMAPSHQVIGVAGDMKESSYEQEIRPRFYEPYQRGEYLLRAGIMVRSYGDPVLLLKPLREILAKTGQGFGAPKITLMKDVLYDSTASHRVFLNYLIVFSAAGLILSALGLYGVLAHEVSRRTREIGVRMSLGATKPVVLQMILKEGLKLILMGIVFGIVGAIGLTRLIENQFYQTSSIDPVTFALVAALLFVVALAASYVPARRAAMVNPMDALRNE